LWEIVLEHTKSAIVISKRRWRSDWDADSESPLDSQVHRDLEGSKVVDGKIGGGAWEPLNNSGCRAFLGIVQKAHEVLECSNAWRGECLRRFGGSVVGGGRCSRGGMG
jgi:hypothetical protein